MTSNYNNWIGARERVFIVQQQAGSVIHRAFQVSQQAKQVNKFLKKSRLEIEMRLDKIQAELDSLKQSST